MDGARGAGRGARVRAIPSVYSCSSFAAAIFAFLSAYIFSMWLSSPSCVRWRKKALSRGSLRFRANSARLNTETKEREESEAERSGERSDQPSASDQTSSALSSLSHSVIGLSPCLFFIL